MLPLYSNSEAGVVLNPAHVQALCAYPSQGWLKGIHTLLLEDNVHQLTVTVTVDL